MSVKSPYVLPDPTTPAKAWEFIRNLGPRLGKQILEKALLAYYVAIDADTPKAERMKLLAALAYLGLPVDAIPDMLPGGFADDGAILLWALYAVASNVRVRHLRRARETMRRWNVPVDEVEADRDDNDPL